MNTQMNKLWQYVLITVATSALVTVGSIGRAVYVNVAQQSPAPVNETTTLVSTTRQKQVSSSIELGRTCFPSGVSESVFIGEFEGTHETFQLWRLTVGNDIFLRANTLFGEVCGLAFDSRYDRIFSDQVSMPYARQLSLLFYQNRAEELGGVPELKANLLEYLGENATSHEGGLALYAPEEIWALAQMGITLPESEYEVMEPKALDSSSI